MLTADERASFEARGVVPLRGAADPGAVAALRARVLEFVAARRLVPEPPEAGFTLNPSQIASVARAHGFAALWGARVVAAVDDLLGRDAWHVPRHAGQLLGMTYPQRGVDWELPHAMWHLDYPAPGATRALPGVQLFLCVDRIRPRGGGTLVVAGVHRIVDAIRRRAGPDWPGRSADVRAGLRREVPWFRELCSIRPGEGRVARFMAEPNDSAAESLQVMELTGDPGDVWLMHPWMVHGLAPNCDDRPRMALTERIRARSTASRSAA